MPEMCVLCNTQTSVCTVTVCFLRLLLGKGLEQLTGFLTTLEELYRMVLTADCCGSSTTDR